MVIAITERMPHHTFLCAPRAGPLPKAEAVFRWHGVAWPFPDPRSEVHVSWALCGRHNTIPVCKDLQVSQQGRGVRRTGASG